MRSTIAVAVAALAVLLALAASPVSAGNQIIFIDYTSGKSFSLPPGLNNPNQQDSTYSTFLPGSINIGLNWNGDASDDFAIALSSLPDLMLVTLQPNEAQCSLAPTGVTLNASNPHCNYTLSWNTAFNGVLSITYNTGGSYAPSNSSAESISIAFQAAQIVGDPQFVGLRGQSYQVHGIDGAVYNIISEKNTQVNARFVFLTEGQCPIINGVADTNCWSHAGSYLGELSFQQVVDGKLHAALVTAGSAKKGFAAVQMDGKTVAVGETAAFGDFSVSVLSSHTVAVSTEHFSFELANSDMFVNQALRSKVALSQLQSHGLLGQTHQPKVYASALRHIEGEVDDYAIADGDIFGDDFVFNKFQL